MEGKGITAFWRNLEYYLLSRFFIPTHFHGNRCLYLLFIYVKLWPTTAGSGRNNHNYEIHQENQDFPKVALITTSHLSQGAWWLH